MLRFVRTPERPALRLLVLHDDEEREFAYTVGAEQALARARERGWTVVSMRDDWETVFADPRAGLGGALGGLAPRRAASLCSGTGGDPDGAQIVGAIFLVGASLLGLVGPVLWYLTHPESAARGLARPKSWLVRHEHALGLAVLVVFGTAFTAKGLAGL